MGVKVSIRKTCRLCNSENLELVVPLPPTPVAEKYVSKDQLGEPAENYPIDLYMCRSCGHVQMLAVVDPSYLWDNYTYHSMQTKGILDHFEECAEKLCKEHKLAQHDRIVDIGSNDGSLLRAFQKRGLIPLGIDPAKDIADEACKAGIETIADFFRPTLAKEIRGKFGPAKIVTAFNVFAHADDMAGMADGIRELLAPDGIFVFEVSYLLDIIDGMLLGTIFHEHLCHHSVTPMISFLKRHGMELISVERVSIQGGSFIGVAQLVGGPRQVSSSVTDLVLLEENRKLHEVDTLKGFANKLNKLKQEVSAFVEECKITGKSIAGYGAARSGETLMAQMDLGNVIKFIVDDHPQKVGKFSPGNHIPVLPTQELSIRKPDYVFILAWIHAKKIIANNIRYLEEGGNFIVCCPEFKIIGLKDVVGA